MMALQIAKRAGLRVICVADAAKHGSRLYDLGADILVDRIDEERAIGVVKSVTGGKLRFALDSAGPASASRLQDALQQSSNGQKAHLLALAGLPKQKPEGIVHHNLPIKIFHDAPIIGEAIMTWLEELLLSNTLTLPHIEIAEGGLSGVNDALDRLRRGEISAKRIVVPVGESYQPKSEPQSPSLAPKLDDLGDEEEHHPELAYADKLNSDPDRLKFAYWVPNVSGVSKIPLAPVFRSANT